MLGAPTATKCSEGIDKSPTPAQGDHKGPPLLQQNARRGLKIPTLAQGNHKGSPLRCGMPTIDVQDNPGHHSSRFGGQEDGRADDLAHFADAAQRDMRQK